MIRGIRGLRSGYGEPVGIHAEDMVGFFRRSMPREEQRYRNKNTMEQSRSSRDAGAEASQANKSGQPVSRLRIIRNESPA